MILCAVLLAVTGQAACVMDYEIIEGPQHATQEPGAWSYAGLRVRNASIDGTRLALDVEGRREREIRSEIERSRDVKFVPNRHAAVTSALNRADNDDAIKWLIIGAAGTPWVLAVAADALSYFLSSLVVVPVGIVASVDSWSTKVESSVDSQLFDLGRTKLEVTSPQSYLAPVQVETDARGRAYVELGEAAVLALRRGELFMSLELKDVASGGTTLTAIKTDQLARLAATAIANGSEAYGTARDLLRDVDDSVQPLLLGRLRERGIAFAETDLEALQLISSQGSSVNDLDVSGVRVDWRSGMPDLPPRLTGSVRLVSAGRSGEPVVVGVEVRNVGKGAVYRLLGRGKLQLRAADAASPLAETLEAPVLFGRIDPGHSMERLATFDVPPQTNPAQALINFDFDELNGFIPPPVSALQVLQPASLAAFAFSLRAVEDNTGSSVGNGDGTIQRGESAEIVVAAKNIGPGLARNVRLSVEVQPHRDLHVFGQATRLFSEVAPGTVAQHAVSVAVKRGYVGRVVPVSVEISDGSGLSALRETIDLVVDSQPPRQVIAVDQMVVATRQAPLLASASTDARPIGAVDAGAVLRAVGELDAFVQIAYLTESGADARAWLPRNSIEAAQSQEKGVPDHGVPAGSAVVREFVNAPPLLALVSPEEASTTSVGTDAIEVKAVAKDPDGLASWRILVAGEVVASQRLASERGLLRVDPDGAHAGPTAWTISETVSVPPGQSELLVEVTDSLGGSSVSRAALDRLGRDPRVVAVVVGLNDYEDPSIPDLRYAEADARAFAEFLHSKRSPVRDPEDVLLLLGASATIRNVEGAIDRFLLRKATGPDDVAIFFFAGHGYSVGERTYLAARDTYLDSLRTTGLRATELAEYWGEIAAGTRILIADACHSGGIPGVRGDNDIVSEIAEQLGGRGTVSFFAAGPSQMSSESTALEHGVFTYSLLRGLNGEAADGRGYVSAKGLAAYLDREVPRLVKQEGGPPQTPVFRADTDGSIQLAKPAD